MKEKWEKCHVATQTMPDSDPALTHQPFLQKKKLISLVTDVWVLPTQRLLLPSASALCQLRNLRPVA